MNSSLVVGLVLAVAGVGVLAWGIPAMMRDTRRRQERGESGLGGMTAGWDAVWAPSAHEAEKERMSQNEAPAPAPSPRRSRRPRSGHDRYRDRPPIADGL